MKKDKLSLASFAQKLQEQDGRLQGGFAIILSAENVLVIGGSEEANNCHGGNCVSGCGSNLEAGCGHNTNTVAGCGSKVNIA
jgi:hypothetical protein